MWRDNRKALYRREATAQINTTARCVEWESTDSLRLGRSPRPVTNRVLRPSTAFLWPQLPPRGKAGWADGLKVPPSQLCTFIMLKVSVLCATNVMAKEMLSQGSQRVFFHFFMRKIYSSPPQKWPGLNLSNTLPLLSPSQITQVLPVVTLANLHFPPPVLILRMLRGKGGQIQSLWKQVILG